MKPAFVVTVLLISVLQFLDAAGRYGESNDERIILVDDNESTEKTSDESTKSKKEIYVWMNLGMGGSFAPSPVIGTGVTGSFQFKKVLFSVRRTHHMALMDSPPDVNEIGVLFGLGTKRIAGHKSALVSVACGISHISGEDERHQDFSSIGLPIEAQLFWTPLPVVGLGVYGYSNINSNVPLFGFLICLQVGKLW